MARRQIGMSRGRKLLLLTLQLTTARAMAARCRLAHAERLSDWANGYRLPCRSSRVALEREYRIPADAWDEPYCPAWRAIARR